MVADTQTTAGPIRAAVEALAARGEPAWLRERRLAVSKTYEATPMPTRQDEDWRRTDIRGLKLDQFQWPRGGVNQREAAPGRGGAAPAARPQG